MVPALELACQNVLCHGALNEALNGLSQGPCAEARVKPAVAQKVFNNLSADFKVNAALFEKALAALLEEQPGNLHDLRMRKRREDAALVYSVPQFQWQSLFGFFQDFFIRRRRGGGGGPKPEVSCFGGEGFGAQVAGHQHNGIGEVHMPALPIRQPALLQNLQKQHEDVPVGFFNFVQDDDTRRAFAHRLRKLASVAITDITCGCADEAADAMAF